MMMTMLWGVEKASMRATQGEIRAYISRRRYLYVQVDRLYCSSAVHVHGSQGCEAKGGAGEPCSRSEDAHQQGSRLKITPNCGRQKIQASAEEFSIGMSGCAKPDSQCAMIQAFASTCG